MYPRLPLLAGITLLAVHDPAIAQTYRDNARLNAGYGRSTGQENTPIDPSTRDASGNRVIVDGLIQTGRDQSLYASDPSSLGGSATAVGNQLIVLTQGSWNTVVVDSTQINNGDISAELNGKVDLDGPR